jgi:hypothetical protein
MTYGEKLMKVTNIVIGTGLLFSSMLAQAEIFADDTGYERDNYFGVMLASPHFRLDDGDVDFRGTGLFVRGGKEFFKYIAIEGHFGVFGADEVGGNEYQIEYMASLFGRGNLFLFDSRARAYLLAGMSYFAGDVPGESGASESSPSFGLGVELYGNSRNSISLEWIRYLDDEIRDDGFTIESINLGYLHRF